MRRHLTPYLFILPALLPLLVFVFRPLAVTFSLSLFDWNLVSPERDWAGVGNYREILGSGEFWVAVGNTLLYGAGLLLANVAVPVLLAYGIMQVPRRWQAVYRSVLFTPTVISLAVASVIFLWLYNPLIGAFNVGLRALGLDPPAWLSDHRWALWAVVGVTAWKAFGYSFIVYLAGLMAVPGELVEAARVEKAREGQIFRRVVLPLTSATLLYLVVTSLITGVQYSFVPVHMLTGGGPNESSTNLVYLTYQYAFQFFRVGEAAAVAILAFGFYLPLILLQALVLERRVHYES